MIQNGNIIAAKIIDENEEAYFVQAEGVTYTVYKQLLDEPFEIGDTIEGMIYQDKNDKNILQTELPDIRPGYYGWGTVELVRKDLGVFVDIGLVDKDIVVSLDDLPENLDLWPKKGDKLYISIEVDNKNRMWGKLANQEIIRRIMQRAPERLMNQDIEAIVYRPIMAGSQAISVEGYEVFIHESERFQEPRLGQQIKGRVIEVHPDGRLNLSLKPRAHETIEGDAKMIYLLLSKIPTHYLPLHDKSDPVEIQNQLGISKGQFKRAVGTLMKQGLIKQNKNDGIYLLEEASEAE